MSAADPYDPNPASGPGFGDATVIDIRSLVSKPVPEGWKPMSGHTPGPGERGSTYLQAEHMEITFNEEHLTLTDDDTATAFRTTLRIVRGVLEGAHAQGIVDESQHHRLDQIFDGLKGAPDLV